MHPLDKIEELSKILKSLSPMKPEWQNKLDKKFRLEFNYNSNHIEGNTLTYSETELLLIFDETRGNHNKREYDEMQAHDVALQMIKEWAAEKERQLSEKDIKNLNEVILVKPFWKEAITTDGQSTRRLIKIGNYKEFPNSVRLQNGEIFEYASPTDTPILMQELIQWYRDEETALGPTTLAAILHYKFVRIHPFDDGNGRVARLLMNYVLFKNGLPPVIIKSTDKQNYLSALRWADTGDYESLITYIAEQVVWSLGISIKAAKGENVDEEDDLDKKLSLLDRNLLSIDPNQEIKKLFNKQVFLEIYRTWGIELLKKGVDVVQKFNKYFIDPSHSISIGNNIGYMGFVNQSPEGILETLTRQVEANSILGSISTETEIHLNAFYGPFAKGGLNTFGCNYGFKVKFDINKYEIFVDEYTGTSQAKSVKVFENLLHTPLTSDELKTVTDKLGNSIFQHIEDNVKKRGIS